MAKNKKTKKEVKEVNKNLISLNEYLSKFNRERVLDNVIKKWYFKKDTSNPMKKKIEWDKIIYSFHNETER